MDYIHELEWIRRLDPVNPGEVRGDLSQVMAHEGEYNSMARNSVSTRLLLDY